MFLNALPYLFRCVSLFFRFVSLFLRCVFFCFESLSFLDTLYFLKLFRQVHDSILNMGGMTRVQVSIAMDSGAVKHVTPADVFSLDTQPTGMIKAPKFPLSSMSQRYRGHLHQ